MDPESRKRVVVTPQFLRSAYELPRERGREVLKALRLFLANPDDASVHFERSAPGADGVQSIWAGNYCRILFSDGPGMKLLFVGVNIAAQRFAERGYAVATAFAEAPIAFQLRIDFWQTGPAAASESPSCGAAISAQNLGGLLLRGRRYLPLAQLLLSRGPEVGSIELRFREIETTLGEALPKSARTRPAWWSNDRSHAQANSWLAIGWQAAALDLQKEMIAFVRNAREDLR
jgi:hypothetical protein